MRRVIIHQGILASHYFVTPFRGVTISMKEIFQLIMTGGVIFLCFIISRGVTILGKSIFTTIPENYQRKILSFILSILTLIKATEQLLWRFVVLSYSSQTKIYIIYNEKLGYFAEVKILQSTCTSFFALEILCSKDTGFVYCFYRR